MQGESLRGKLLIAGAGLFDPNFRRAVLLIGEHNDEGALGVILNRPTPSTVGEVVPPLAEIAGDDDRLFVGGPVQPESAVLLAEFAHPDSADLLVFDSIGFLMGAVEAEAVRDVKRARVFAGYAGWAAGQLEGEISSGSWFVFDALPGDAFVPRPDDLWPMVLRRQGGITAAVAIFPADPAMN